MKPWHASRRNIYKNKKKPMGNLSQRISSVNVADGLIYRAANIASSTQKEKPAPKSGYRGKRNILHPYYSRGAGNGKGEMRMLKITDISRLRGYGFEYQGKNNSGRDIWSLSVGDYGFETIFTVNPLRYDGEEVENELAIWTEFDVKYKDHADNFARYNGMSSVELEFDCDILFHMIADGVVTVTGIRKVAEA